MPIAVFIIFAFALQAVNMMASIAIEQYVSKGVSVTVFALLYFAAFWLAWKLTVWVIDSRRSVAGTTKQQNTVGAIITLAQLPMFS